MTADQLLFGENKIVVDYFVAAGAKLGFVRYLNEKILYNSLFQWSILTLHTIPCQII